MTSKQLCQVAAAGKAEAMAVHFKPFVLGVVQEKKISVGFGWIKYTESPEMF